MLVRNSIVAVGLLALATINFAMAQTTTSKRIYLAGPLGFSEVGRDFHEKIVRAVIDAGHIPLDPWKLTDPNKIAKVVQLPFGQAKRDAWRVLNKEIGANNAKAIESCDVMFAVLDGVDVDSGTAAEIGYAAALGKRIIGYRGDFRLSSDNEGSEVNLQVEYFILRSGGSIVRDLSSAQKLLSQL